MLRTIVIAVAAAIAAAPAIAQDWPTRPVTMVVTFAPGTAGDVVGRILSGPLGEALGRTVITDNVPGGGGITGSNRIAKAAPDGYQFLVGTVGTHAIAPTLYKNPPYNAVTDFAPVGLLLEQPIVLLTRKDLPATTLQEFAAYAKEHQKTMQYGSGGTGTANHLACARLNMALGVNIVHVPYRSTSAMQDLMAGRIDYTCNFLSTSMAQIESKQITAISILTKARSPISPLIATAHEQGLTDFDAATWSGFLSSKKHARRRRAKAQQRGFDRGRHAVGTGEAPRTWCDRGRAGAPLARLPAGLHRERDQEVGGADQGRQPDGELKCDLE